MSELIHDKINCLLFPLRKLQRGIKLFFLPKWLSNI